MIPKTKQEYKNILQNLRREKRVLRKKLEEIKKTINLF